VAYKCKYCGTKKTRLVFIKKSALAQHIALRHKGGLRVAALLQSGAPVVDVSAQRQDAMRKRAPGSGFLPKK
jgi:hypothetical protein